MSEDIFVEFINREPISFKGLCRIIISLENIVKYTYVTSWKTWKISKGPIEESCKILWNEGGSILFNGFFISFDKKHSLKKLNFNFGLRYSLISGEDKETLETLIRAIILIAKNLFLEKIVSYQASIGPEQKVKWVCYFKGLHGDVFKDWSNGKIVQMKDGVLVFINKHHIASIDEHEEFNKFLIKKKNI